jgi:hypothetical protein
MIQLIYTKPVESPNEGNLVLKRYKVHVELLRSSVEGSDIYLHLVDAESSETSEEILTIPGKVQSLDTLKEYLLDLPYFQEC